MDLDHQQIQLQKSYFEGFFFLPYSYSSGVAICDRLLALNWRLFKKHSLTNRYRQNRDIYGGGREEDWFFLMKPKLFAIAPSPVALMPICMLRSHLRLLTSWKSLKKVGKPVDRGHKKGTNRPDWRFRRSSELVRVIKLRRERAWGESRAESQKVEERNKPKLIFCFVFKIKFDMENCKASKADVSKLYEVNKKIKSKKSFDFTL